MKNTLKTIITTMLVSAILITGICTGETVTVNAATKASYVQKWSTITMKPGDTKKVIVTDTDGNDITTKYKWTSSDKSIVKVNMDFVSQSDFTECLELIAAGSGTVTLTGKAVSLLEEYQTTQLTVTVKMAGPTAKQKKCKHKFVVNRKPTCERLGLKTCRRCKLQKSIKCTGHKYVNATIKEIEYDGWELVITCTGCDCSTDDEIAKCYEAMGKGIECDTACNYTVILSAKKLGHIRYPFHYDKVIYAEDFGETDFGTDLSKDWCGPAADELRGLIAEHHVNTKMKHYTYEDSEYYYGPHEVTKSGKACKYCGKEK